MNMIDRVKNIILTPKTEWPVIESEASTTQGLLLNYAAPLAAIGAVAGFISGSLIGTTVPFVGITVRTPIIMGVVGAIVALVLGLAMVFVLSLIIDALAPSFGAEKNPSKALKVAVYSMTAAWVAGLFQILPWIGILFLLAGALYSIYLLYTGLQALMHSPEDKVIGYTAVVIVCAIVISVVMGLVVGAITAVGAGVGALGSTVTSSRSANVTFDKGSPMAKLEQFGKSMEAVNKNAEAAKAAGKPEEAAAIAMAGMAAAMNGGKKIEALDSATLKTFVPDTLGGLAKTSSKSEKTGAIGMVVSTAEASYGDGSGKSIRLEITDTGSAAGFLAMAGMVKVEGEKEDANGSEKTYKSGGRTIHERSSKTGGSNEYSLILGDRFTVKAVGNGVDLAGVKAAVASLDLGKLEGMKDASAVAAK
jgi:Yip1 domain